MKRFVVFLALSACVDEPMTIAEYPAARLSASCEYFRRCGAIPTIEECRATQPEYRFSPYVLAAVEAGTVRWNGDAARACIERLGVLSCDRASERHRSLRCGRLFTGTLYDGEACELGVECISNECWIESCSEACCVGYCVGDLEPVIGEIDEPCRLSGCVAGARCESSVCVPLRAAGEACEWNDECDYGLLCIRGSCSVPNYNGEQCTEGSCAMVGELCGFHGVCEPAGRLEYPCLETSHCDINYVCGADSRCVQAPRIGQNCSLSSDRCFDAGAFCDVRTHTCTLPKPDGAACWWWDECESQYCADGACARCE